MCSDFIYYHSVVGTYIRITYILSDAYVCIYMSKLRRGKTGSEKEIVRIKMQRSTYTVRVFTNLSRTLLAWRRSFSRTALVPGSSQSSSALEQRLFKDKAN